MTIFNCNALEMSGFGNTLHYLFAGTKYKNVNIQDVC